MRRPFLWIAVTLFIGIITLHCWEEKHGGTLVFSPPDFRMWMEEKGVSEANLTVSGEILWIQETSSGYAVLCDTKSSNYGKVRAYVKEDLLTCSYLPGDLVSISGRCFLMAQAENPGQFDLRSYYDSLEYFLGMSVKSVEKVGEKFTLKVYLFKIYLALVKSIEGHAQKADLGQILALFLNNRTSLGEQEETDYSGLGLFYLFSASGFFVSAIGMGLFEFLRKATGKPFFAAGLTVCLIGAYVVLCGTPVSGVRALLIVVLKIGSFFVKRRFDLLTGAGWSLIFLLLFHPSFAFLSSVQYYLAVLFAIGVLAPRVLRCFFKRPPLFLSLVYGLSIQICLLPLQLLQNGCCSPYTCLLGLLLGGFRVLIWVLIFLAAVLGVFSGVGVTLSNFLFGAVHGFLGLQNQFVEWGNLLPGNLLIQGAPAGWRIGLFAGGVGLVLLYFYAWDRKLRVTDEWDEPDIGLKEYSHCVCLLLSLLAFGWLFLRVDPLTENEAEITILSVGQGDCTLIRTGGGHAYLIDGGSSDDEELGKNVLEPVLYHYGVSKLDAIYITHDDTDHQNGIQYLLAKGIIQVGRICISKARSSDDFTWLPADIPVRALKTGDRDGPFMTLWPSEESDLFHEVTGNDISICLEWNFGGFSALFTGDISAEVEKELPLTHTYTMLKVAHHGSRFSSSGSFLNQVQPRFVTISYGKNNVYGHPAEDTLKRLNALGTLVYRTGEQGAIQIQLNKEKGYRITPYF